MLATKTSLLNSVHCVLSYCTCLVLYVLLWLHATYFTCPRASRASWLTYTAFRALVSDVPRASLALVPVSCALHALVPDVSHSLRTLAPHVPHVLHALVSHVSWALRTPLPHFLCVSCALNARMSFLSCTIESLVSFLLHLFQLSHAQNNFMHVISRSSPASHVPLIFCCFSYSSVNFTTVFPLI